MRESVIKLRERSAVVATDNEEIWLKIQLENDHQILHVGCVYRPHNSDSAVFL